MSLTRNQIRLSFLSVVLASAHFAYADAPTTAPDVATIVAKSTEAAGGHAHLDKINALDVRGTMVVTQQNVGGAFSLVRKADRALLSADIPGVGKITSGWLGDVVYQMSDVMGARLISGPEKEDLLRDLDLRKQFAPLEQLSDLKVVGVESVNDSPAWKLMGKTPSGRDETHWIDQKNYLTLRTKMQVMTDMGLIEASSDFTDYKTIEGITIPYTTTQTVGPAVVVLKLTDVKLNPDLSDDLFKLPPEVQKLVQKRDAATQPTTVPALK